MHRGRRVARPRVRVQRRGSERAPIRRGDTIGKQRRERDANGAGRPARLADRSAGRNGRCMLCVCAPNDDSCVSLSPACTALLREGSHERLGDVTETDRDTRARARERRERERRRKRDGEKEKNAGEERKTRREKGTAGALEDNRRRTNATRYDVPGRIAPECKRSTRD